MLDVIWTTITTKGSGPLSRHLVHALKGLFLFFYRCSGNREVLVLAGPVTLIAVGFIWLAGLWLGWFLLLLGVGGVVESNTGTPASVVQYLYYTGMTLSTLGIGDYKAGNDFVRLLTSVAAFNGLILVTLIITYAIPMVGA
ncbi:ion channel [Nitrincola sp. A-D6]|uniref:ion channel n=1 Tax=Nitrincola sp. A-D6 TaxID=1545442 RepID=UPI00068EC46D|nr:ion channel [Nitrincola sp. A-D6]